MSNNPYIVIIYSGATNKGANSIIASYIAAGVKKSGMNVVGPIDINFKDSQEEDNLITTITNSSGLIIGSGVYNGNIEPSLTSRETHLDGVFSCIMYSQSKISFNAGPPEI